MTQPPITPPKTLSRAPLKDLRRHPRVLYLVAESSAHFQDGFLLEILEYCAGTSASTKAEIIRHIESFRKEHERFHKWLDAAVAIAAQEPEWTAYREKLNQDAELLRSQCSLYAQKFRRVVQRNFPDQVKGERLVYLEREVLR